MLKPFKILCFLAVLGSGMATLIGCAGLLSWATQEDVSWTYLQTKSSGLKLFPTLISDSTITLRFDVKLTFDSALCLSAPTGRVLDKHIVIHFKKSLCPSHPQPLELTLSKPQSGQYQIVYDDENKTLPVIGYLDLP